MKTKLIVAKKNVLAYEDEALVELWVLRQSNDYQAQRLSVCSYEQAAPC